MRATQLLALALALGVAAAPPAAARPAARLLNKSYPSVDERRQTIVADVLAAAGQDPFATAAQRDVVVTRNTAASPIYGHPYCDYAAPVNVNGTTFHLLLDTGSSDTAIATNLCTTCNVTPTLTTDNATSPYSYGVVYGDQSSWIAYPTTLPVSLNGTGRATQDVFDASISLITSENKFFLPECPNYQQGIMGLAYKGLASTSKVTPLPDSWTTANISDAFSFQICPISYPPTGTKQSGNWFVGGFPTSLLASPMLFTPIISTKWYVVDMRGLLVGSKRLNFDYNAEAPIVDSGTTGMYLPSDIFSAIVTELRALSAIQFSSNIAAATVESFWKNSTFIVLNTADFTLNDSASMKIEFRDATSQNGNITVTLKVRDYVFVQRPDANNMTRVELGILDSGVASGNGSSVGIVLGHSLHMNKIVYYDRGVTNQRIGFGEGLACEYLDDGSVDNGDGFHIDVISPSASDGFNLAINYSPLNPSYAPLPSIKPTSDAARGAPVVFAATLPAIVTLGMMLLQRL